MNNEARSGPPCGGLDDELWPDSAVLEALQPVSSRFLAGDVTRGDDAS
jgi:hypothetical protein